MAPWLRVLEAYLVQALLRTPAFHRGVEKVARSVHRIRHGIPPEEMGGTKIDRPGDDGFFRHFSEEVQAQLGRAEARDAALKNAEGAGRSGRTGRANEANEAAVEGGEESAEAVWRRSQSSGAEHTNKTTAQVEDENAEAAWASAQKQASRPPKQGFMQEYMGALRDQMKNGR